MGGWSILCSRLEDGRAKVFVVFALKRRADLFTLSCHQCLPEYCKIKISFTEMVGNFIAAAFFMYVDLISA